MIKQFTIATIIGVMLFSCSTGSDKKQSEYAGGTFSYALNNEPSTFIVRDITDVYSSKIATQVMEGLVALNPKTLIPEGRLAKDVSVSNDGITYTFTLNENVKFHPHQAIGENRTLTMDDVKYSFELVCKKGSNNNESAGYKTIFEGLVEGAEEYHNGTAESISGIKVNGNVMTIKLLQRDQKFLDKLCMPNATIVAKEVVENGSEGDLIGTGPFKYADQIKTDKENKMILVKNQDYYKFDDKGNALPYLDTIEFYFEGNKLEQLEMFEDAKIHVIDGLPSDRITDMFEDNKQAFSSTPPLFLLKRKPMLATQYYQFNMLADKFKDVKVRKAINYAINRNAIINNILNNQAYGPGNAGLIPPAAFSGYDAKAVKKHGYTFNPEKAKQLLAEAGYPNGEGFPSIELKFNFGTIHSAVADEFSRQIKKTLNINVNITGLDFEDKIRDVESANGDMFRTSWYADYLGPETFLQNAYGKPVPKSIDEPSQINSARYVNPEFDKYFEAGRKSDDIIERYKNFSEAEKIMMDDSPFCILWYEESIIISYSKVRDLELNALGLYDFTNVYLKDWSEEEYLNRIKK